MKTAVVGGGPAGLLAGWAASGTSDVVLFEKKEGCGRKLLLSGSGQCNLTHQGDVRDFLMFYGDRARFVRPALMNFPPDKLLNFFQDRGVSFDVTEGGKVFPQSRRSQEILGVLSETASGAGVRFLLQKPVEKIVFEDDAFFVYTGNGKKDRFDRLILTTGGQSYPGTGSEGDGFLFAKALGHNIIPPRPALTDLYMESFPFAEEKGISFDNAGIRVFRQDKQVFKAEGELLITHRGLSGPVILNNSRHICAGDLLKVDFSGYGNDFDKQLLRQLSYGGKKSVLSLLRQLSLPDRLARKAMQLASVPLTLKGSQLSKDDRKQLNRFIASCPCRIDSLGGFKRAMVTAGGVDTAEVNPRSMESRIVPGLYFAGEVLDVDGDTGGYNLQWAFSSGYLAGKSTGNTPF